GRGVVGRVPLQPVGAAEKKARPAAGAYRAQESARGLVHELNVVAVDLHGGDAETFGARIRPWSAREAARARRRSEAVVLADEEDRKIVDAGPVETFEKGTAIHRAVAEEADDDLAAAAQLHRMRGPGCDRDPRADDAVGAQHADGEVGDVHGAA